ncbi:prolipoprotein diacylglyceryl transferase [candidate division WWE3 bacterium]|uniref:Phosphatidylglycerol--prolipoprotein diacylglyceryl transferase n=1 Tax=candidate division WWE3 bacterium TaxID=2053526 RepID=A0A928TQZ7_UNCKA|nr:prolipoprotein diacylglyceryl transferase [candidate division WWE3 bacterium]
MIPWIESKTYSLGPLTLQTWGTFVAAGFLIGAWIAAKRAKKFGLDPKHVWDMAFWVFFSAMIGSRIFHVLFYEPAYYLQHPLEAIDPSKPGFAIMGGFLGAALAFTLIVRKRKLDWMAYADTLVWGLPWGCGIGRIGCFLIHDHPGTLTNSPLGVQYPDGNTRNDLGLYLSILGFSIGILFLLLNRKRWSPGFFLGTYMVVYGIVRFWLDVYRIVDVRYVGLTPTQWFLFVFVAIGILILHKTQKKGMRGRE